MKAPTSLSMLIMLVFMGLVFLGCSSKTKEIETTKEKITEQLQHETEGSGIYVSAKLSKTDHSHIKELLGKPHGAIPPDPGGKVLWGGDFQKALEQARLTRRPILVTWRCLPCKQCAEFDKGVLDGSPKLTPLLRRFVTVRLTDAAFLDERYFPFKTHQDLDLSWWAYFLSSEGEYYGVFGGKDHVSDATRISESALVKSMERVLAHHYDPRRKKWNVDLPVGFASKTKSSPKDLKGYQLLGKIRPELGKPFQLFGSCIHCHQVGDMLNIEAMDDGTFNLDQFNGQWPLPENVGILLDRDDGLLVKQITPLSPAAEAGIKAGDQLGMANGMRLYGQADFRGVLHRAAIGEDLIQVAWTREGQAQAGILRVQTGWRKTENSWRKTVYDGVYGPGMGFFPLKGPKSGKGQGLSVKPWMGQNPKDRPIYQTGLRAHMEIIEINGMTQDMETRQLIAWFRLNFKSGQEVTYTVRGGQQFKYVLP